MWLKLQSPTIEIEFIPLVFWHLFCLTFLLKKLFWNYRGPVHSSCAPSHMEHSTQHHALRVGFCFLGSWWGYSCSPYRTYRIQIPVSHRTMPHPPLLPLGSGPACHDQGTYISNFKSSLCLHHSLVKPCLPSISLAVTFSGCSSLWSRCIW